MSLWGSEGIARGARRGGSDMLEITCKKSQFYVILRESVGEGGSA